MNAPAVSRIVVTVTPSVTVATRVGRVSDSRSSRNSICILRIEQNVQDRLVVYLAKGWR